MLGAAIGVGTALAFALLPALLSVAIWILVSVYAIVKWVGSAPQGPNPTVIAVGVVGIVSLLTVLIATAVSLIGRSMNAKRRA